MRIKDKQAFIKTFVNQMYGILIGLGIGSILFDSAFDISNWYDIAMVIFVTSVVVVYWWDWIEYIEDEIITTKLEMIFDFIILITLEMLFVYYRQPQYLALTFVFLSLFDLIWVINHIRCNERYKEKYKSHVNKWRWILEKTLSIIVYVLLFVFMSFVLPYLSQTMASFTTVSIFTLTFIIVRKFSFREIFNSRHFKIQLAEEIEVSEIVKINNSYFNGDSHELIKKYKIEEMIDEIKKKNVIVAYDNKNTIVGYAVLKPNGAKEYFDSTEIYKPNLKNLLNNADHVLIEQIAIKQDMKREGIGSILMEYILEQYDDVLLSFIAREPYDNINSVNFHLKNGFSLAGHFEKNIFAERKNYRSELYIYQDNKLINNKLESE